MYYPNQRQFHRLLILYFLRSIILRLRSFSRLNNKWSLEFYMSNNNNKSINFQSNEFFVNGSPIKDNFTDIDLVGNFLVPSFYDWDLFPAWTNMKWSLECFWCQTITVHQILKGKVPPKYLWHLNFVISFLTFIPLHMTMWKPYHIWDLLQPSQPVGAEFFSVDMVYACDMVSAVEMVYTVDIREALKKNCFCFLGIFPK